MTLPRWKRVDEVNLRERVRRLLQVGEVRPPATVDPPRLVGQPGSGCSDCRDHGHRHAAVRVGPFLICRCLQCPVLVVAP